MPRRKTHDEYRLEIQNKYWNFNNIENILSKYLNNE